MIAAIVTASMATFAHAQIAIPAANLGSDGPFAPSANRQVILGSAPTGVWDQPTSGGRGVYDPEQWAVVYKYTAVSIPANVTVTFANHPSGAPVVWLVDGDVLINGTIDVRGQNGRYFGSNFAEGGPGGFRGGKGGAVPGDPVTAGFGPGGGLWGVGGASGNGSGAGYSTPGGANGTNPGGPVYGSAEIIPLIGGSGGGAQNGDQRAGGGGGGGAILIIARGTITINGTIVANGGSDRDGNRAGGGSGGAIRLVCDTLTGNSAGLLVAVGGVGGGTGGYGRISTEANLDTLPDQGNPIRRRAITGTTAKIWPDATSPRVTAATLGNRSVPADPRGLLTFPGTDVGVNSAVFPVLTINAANVPTDGSAVVNVRILPATQNAAAVTVVADFVSGNNASSVWRATLPLTSGISAIQTSVTLP